MDSYKINFKKTIYNNKETSDFINNKFSDIIKPTPKTDTKTFFDNYEKFFYKIPKIGKNSHTTLLEQSREYINDYKNPNEDKILELNENIETLYNTLSNKQSKEKEENLFYPNKTLLKFENNTNPLPIWIMQNGSKRKITNGDTLSTIKKILGYEYDTPTNDIVQKLDLQALNEILEGPEISSDKDLNLFDFISNDVDLDLIDLVDFTTSWVTCIEGIKDELYDLYKPPNSDGWQINGYSPNEGQNRPRKDYLEGSPMNGGCIIRKYGIGLNEAGEIYQSTRRIYPGETIKIWYRNNPIINGQTVNNHSKLHDVTGFIKEIRKTNGNRSLSNEEYRRDELGLVHTTLQPHLDHLDDIDGNTRVRFYDVPQETDQY